MLYVLKITESWGGHSYASLIGGVFTSQEKAEEAKNDPDTVWNDSKSTSSWDVKIVPVVPDVVLK